MKLRTRKQCERWEVVGFRRYKRRLRQKMKAQSRRRARDPLTSGSLLLAAPDAFCIGNLESRTKLLKFIKILRLRVLVTKKPVHIDFRPTIKTISCGTLLFLAELDRIRRLSPHTNLISCRLPQDKIVLQVFDQVGILPLLGRKKGFIDEGEYDATVKHWNFASGAMPDATEFESFLDYIEGRVTPILSSSIFKGVTEAMTNSVHHAYEGWRDDGVTKSKDKRWWMFSQEKDGMLTVVQCDLGIGIPRSLPKIDSDTSPEWLSILNGFLEKYSKKEPALIKAALEIGKSRTKKPERGLGFSQIIDVVRKAKKGTVIIHSNAGYYKFAPNEVLTETLVQYSDSIMGTLIQWQVPIESQE